MKRTFISELRGSVTDVDAPESENVYVIPVRPVSTQPLRTCRGGIKRRAMMV